MRSTEPDQDEGRVRPFADVLRDLGHGAVVDEAAVQLQELVAAVALHGKKGTFTLTLEVAPMRGAGGTYMVSAKAVVKPPAGEPVAAVFFADKDHNLIREDPNQPQLPLRDASINYNTGEIR